MFSFSASYVVIKMKKLLHNFDERERPKITLNLPQITRQPLTNHQRKATLLGILNSFPSIMLPVLW